MCPVGGNPYCTQLKYLRLRPTAPPSWKYTPNTVLVSEWKVLRSWLDEPASRQKTRGLTFPAKNDAEGAPRWGLTWACFFYSIRALSSSGVFFPRETKIIMRNAYQLFFLHQSPIKLNWGPYPMCFVYHICSMWGSWASTSSKWSGTSNAKHFMVVNTLHKG